MTEVSEAGDREDIVTAHECGQPGRLHPPPASDRTALAGDLESEAFRKASMVARCAQHAPADPPVAMFDGQVEACDWLLAPPCTVCGAPLDQVLIGEGFTDHGEVA